jgi:hypothetical protein
VRYRANPTAPGYNPAAKERVIELVEAQVDPMEPSRHKHKKVRQLCDWHGPGLVTLGSVCLTSLVVVDRSLWLTLQALVSTLITVSIDG